MVPEQNEKVIIEIAAMCHWANKAWCHMNGDSSQPDWEGAPAHMRASAVEGVKFRIQHMHATPEDQHEAWYHAKAEAGWKHGPTKNPDKKEHPCMVAYHELPYEQQMKDSIFSRVCIAMITKAIEAGKLVIHRVPTEGEEAIDVSFNVGGNPVVKRIKQAFADLHDLCIRESDKHRVVILNREAKKHAAEGPMQLPAAAHRMGRLMAVALTHLEISAMAAVKSVTR